MRAIRFVVMSAIAAALAASATVAVSAQEVAAPQPPAVFNGRVWCGPPVSPERAGAEETLEAGDEGWVLTRNRDGAWRQSASVNDPRLEGDWYHTWENDAYALPDAATGPAVAAATWRIENEEGAWQGGALEASLPDGTRIETATVLVGEGAYEGLIAILDGEPAADEPCAVDIKGIIFEGAPALEPFSPE
jgi:hypothetical protein